MFIHIALSVINISTTFVSKYVKLLYFSCLFFFFFLRFLEPTSYRFSPGAILKSSLNVTRARAREGI